VPAGGAELARGAALLPSPVAGRAPVDYQDPRYGFRLSVPGGWRQASVADEDRPALAADYDLVWEDPDSRARLSVSAWEGSRLTSFLLWTALVGAGMQSIDGQLPTNAVVAGQPALLLWAAESPSSPTRYALFLEHGGTFYRLAYGAHDGGAALGDFARALVSLRWDGEADAVDVLPLRVAPADRYWPSERLFGP
jgi:hypothetical protein